MSTIDRGGKIVPAPLSAANRLFSYSDFLRHPSKGESHPFVAFITLRMKPHTWRLSGQVMLRKERPPTTTLLSS